jgi:hypothetical protein
VFNTTFKTISVTTFVEVLPIDITFDPASIGVVPNLFVFEIA